MIVDMKKVQLAITVDNKPFELKRGVEDSSVQRFAPVMSWRRYVERGFAVL
jgi:hypothetical protein